MSILIRNPLLTSSRRKPGPSASSKDGTPAFAGVTILLFLLGAPAMAQTQLPNKTDTATFAGGCFWCMQPSFNEFHGVLSTKVGYTGGRTVNPTYEDVCTGTTDRKSTRLN